jgi:hypothetical protein
MCEGPFTAGFVKTKATDPKLKEGKGRKKFWDSGRQTCENENFGKIFEMGGTAIFAGQPIDLSV